MNSRIPCITDSDEFRFESDDLQHSRAIEEYADTIMDECKTYNHAVSINSDNDLYDGELLPKLMNQIAKWDGSSVHAVIQMKAMFNILADEFQKIAEREVR